MTVAGFARITVNPELMGGQPCVRNMRLTVRRVLEAMAVYPDRSELFREYPELEEDDIRQVLDFAAANPVKVSRYREALSKPVQAA
jgi:uncharacterized protein (DUF433 family)